MFLRKWENTFKEWYGEDEGNKYAKQYFKRVLKQLLLHKIKRGRIWEVVYLTGLFVKLMMSIKMFLLFIFVK